MPERRTTEPFQAGVFAACEVPEVLSSAAWLSRWRSGAGSYPDWLQQYADEERQTHRSFQPKWRQRCNRRTVSKRWWLRTFYRHAAGAAPLGFPPSVHLDDANKPLVAQARRCAAAPRCASRARRQAASPP